MFLWNSVKMTVMPFLDTMAMNQCHGYWFYHMVYAIQHIEEDAVFPSNGLIIILFLQIW